MTNENEEKTEFETLRKPLAPILPANGVEDEMHKRRMKEYENLLAEFNAIKELRQGLNEWNASKLTSEELKARKDEHENRFAAYKAAREDYNRRNDGFIETMEMVKANIERLRERMHKCAEEVNEDVGDPPDFPIRPFRWDYKTDEQFEAAKKDYDEKMRIYDEWHAKLSECSKRGDASTHAMMEFLEEQDKFKEIGDAFDKAFEDMARRTLVDGTVLSDEELAQREAAKKDA